MRCLFALFVLMNISDFSLSSYTSIASVKPSSVSASNEIDLPPAAKEAQGTETTIPTTSKAESKDSVKLSDKAKAIVRSLQARDQQVRAHEQAHLAASGGLATLEQQASSELLAKASEELQAKLKSAYQGNDESSNTRIDELA